jgi:Family of unknown function (DUF6232)
VLYKRKLITVQVSGRILWVDEAAYPLRNIARVQKVKVPKVGPPLTRYLLAVVLCVIVGVAAAVYATRSAGLPSPDLRALHDVEVFAIMLVVISAIGLIALLSRRSIWALLIETSGTPRAAFASTDEKKVTRLVQLIMEAINNPAAEFEFKVESIHIGDKIEQFGSGNIGKVSK